MARNVANAALPQARPALYRAGGASIARQVAAAFEDERPIVLALVVLTALAHGLNMFDYPASTFRDDEGIYAEQAWAVLRQGRLAPYTYVYDHSPGGWILMAVWMLVSGGVNTFGSAVDGGRMLMLILHAAMAWLLYRLARKLACPAPAAAFGVLVFGVSPLSTFFMRMMLLDPIMLFWALLSLDLLLDGQGRLSRVAGSGLCFGLALVSKETAVVLLPAMVYIAVQQRHRHQQGFGVVAWLLPMSLVGSLYFLYAFLKGELLPAGWLGSAPGDHVSLITALIWQATRGGGGLLNPDNLFRQLLRTEWLPLDPFLLIGGTAAAIANLARGIRSRQALAGGLLGLLPMLYLARGGVVLDFYVIVALPFLCLNLALLLGALTKRLPGVAGAAIAALSSLGLVAGYLAAGTLQPLYERHPGDAGRMAVAWIKANVPADSKIVTRDDLWTDLREPNGALPGFPNVHSHWRVAGDPAVRDGVFDGSGSNVDYLIMSPGLAGIFRDTNDQVALEALDNAHPVKSWKAEDSEVELWKVDRIGETEQRLVAGSARFLTSHFERDGAYVGSDGVVTAESQASAMLRAVWMNDRAEFDRVWGWTARELLDGGVLAWSWRNGAVSDRHSTSDADTDAALALLMAGRRWDDPTLLAEGTSLVRAIWQREVIVVAGEPYLAAGDWIGQGGSVELNPSHFAPYAYRVFQQVDPDHPWLALVDSSYRTLSASSSLALGTQGSAGLPPDWLALDRATGRLFDGDLPAGGSAYSYDAPRAYWRVALDAVWSGDARAFDFLKQAGFIRQAAAGPGQLGSVYAHDGSVRNASPSMVGNAGALAVLLQTDPEQANGFYDSRIFGASQRAGGDVFWGEPGDLYSQEWAWFAVALYANTAQDIWDEG